MKRQLNTSSLEERDIPRQAAENQVSGRQPRRAAFWDAQHTGQYVSNHKRSRNTGSRPETPF
jgi:hypothetical protein